MQPLKLKNLTKINPSKRGTSAISVFGAPEYKRSWRITPNGLEGVCSLYNDSLLPLDEFGEAEAKDVGAMAYQITQGMGKQRATRNGNAREPKVWTVLVLSTGEVGLFEHMQDGKKSVKAGQMVRFIDIPAELANGYGCFETIHNYRNGDEFAKALDQLCSQYYGTLARVFVQEVIDYGIDHTRRDLRFIIDDFVADYATGHDGQVKRITSKFGLVYAALSLAVKRGILGSQVSDDMVKWTTTTCLYDWLDDRGTTGDMESYNLINQVKGLLNENAEGKFVDVNMTEEKHIRHSIWGYKSGAKFYLLPKAFKEYICAGFDSKQAAKILAEYGLLHKGNDNKNSRLERIPAHIKPVDRFYVIDLSQD